MSYKQAEAPAQGPVNDLFDGKTFSEMEILLS